MLDLVQYGHMKNRMRADRLISMMLLLHTRGRLTPQELAQELEVSERTIYQKTLASQAFCRPA
jgi:DeoR/GlpR family transcriptional regulator of sugar metabolism